MSELDIEKLKANNGCSDAEIDHPAHPLAKHTMHCRRRMVWGDGECECHVSEIDRLNARIKELEEQLENMASGINGVLIRCQINGELSGREYYFLQTLLPAPPSDKEDI